MMVEVKFEFVEGIHREDVTKFLRKKYQDIRIISMRVDVGKQDIPQELRKDFIQSYKVYFVPDVEKLIKQINEEIELK